MSIKQRQSNIELLRIVCMILIVAGHANNLVYGIPMKTEMMAAPAIMSFRIIAYQLCVVAVNCFVFISGWFAIKTKFKKGTRLIIQTLEYGLGLSLLFLLLGFSVPKMQFIRIFLIGENYWFIIAYLQLFILAPALNFFAEKASQNMFKTVVVSCFVFEFIYGWIGGVGNYADGYSGIHFVGLYLLAQYIRNYVKFEKITHSRAWMLYLTPAAVSVALIGAGGGVLVKNGNTQC